MRRVLDFGVANIGQAPTFLLLKDLGTLIDVAHPVIFEMGQGLFYFDLDFPIPSSPDTTTIVFKVTCNGLSESGTLTSQLPISVEYPLRAVVDFGDSVTGQAPAFLMFEDVLSFAPLPQPAFAEIGVGLYYFPYTFPVPTSPGTMSIAFVATAAGVNLSDVISAVGDDAYPGAVTLADLRTRVRQRSDMEYSQFVTDPEIDGYINVAAGELYDYLVSQYGDDYFFAEPFQIVTNGSDELYPLPSDFLKLKGVDLKVDATHWTRIDPFTLAQRNRFGAPTASTTMWWSNIRYRIRGKFLWLSPMPNAGQMFRLLYVQRYTRLVNDLDLLDGFDGWEEYVVVTAAMKCLAKEESDVGPLSAEKAGIEQRIQAAAAARDPSAPQQVADVQRGGVDLPDTTWLYGHVP